jgi:DNA-binding IclR family transcriptional regulator
MISSRLPFWFTFIFPAALHASTWQPVKSSLRMLADETGLSKSAVQSALATLHFRQLVETSRAHRTAVPTHRVLRHWRSNRARRRSAK